MLLAGEKTRYYKKTAPTTTTSKFTKNWASIDEDTTKVTVERKSCQKDQSQPCMTTKKSPEHIRCTRSDEGIKNNDDDNILIKRTRDQRYGE